MDKRSWIRLLLAICATGIMIGCASPKEEWKPDEEGGGDRNPSRTAFADPDGVMILDQGLQQPRGVSDITYIAPDGEVKTKQYYAVNGSIFGTDAQDLFIAGGKLFILSNSAFDSTHKEAGNGAVVIADAASLRKQKAFVKELTFPRPEGSTSKEERLSLRTPLGNIAVIDDRNVFLSDVQGMFRLDATTGKLALIEGSYAFGNQGATIETMVASRGMTVVGDKLYCGGGGFWAGSRSLLFQFDKDKDKVARSLPIQGEFISGICRNGEHELIVATCGRKGETKSFLNFVDIREWKLIRSKRIKADISAEFMNSAGVARVGDYLYFAAGSLTVSRVSLTTGKAEEYIHLKNDAPEAERITCNVVGDDAKQRLYVSVVGDLFSPQANPDAAMKNIIIYDCSGEEPRVVAKIENKASYPVNIYPVSKFY